MAMTLAVVDATPETLGELAEDINQRYVWALDAANTWTQNAIVIGEELEAARRQVAVGSWCRWVEDNIQFSRSEVNRFIRLWEYRDVVLSSGASTVMEAAVAVRGLPRTRPQIGGRYPIKLTPERRKRVLEGRKEGLTWQEIGREFGSTGQVVRLWVDQEYKRAWRGRQAEREKVKRQQTRAAKDAIERAERDDLAKRAGGNISSAYAEVRKALQHLDLCIRDATETDVREALRQALSHAHKSEDAIVAALRGKVPA